MTPPTSGPFVRDDRLMITLDITIVNIALPSLQAAGIIAVGAIAVAVVMNTPRPSRQAAADHADLHALG